MYSKFPGDPGEHGGGGGDESNAQTIGRMRFIIDAITYLLQIWVSTSLIPGPGRHGHSRRDRNRSRAGLKRTAAPPLQPSE